MQRVQQGFPATITETYYVGTEPATVDSVTVDVVRDDGTVLLEGADAEVGEDDDGTVSYALITTETELLDRLTVTWHAEIGEEDDVPLRSYVEVVGGFYFTLPELAAHRDVVRAGGDPTDAQLADARTRAEQRWEQECACAFVPRYGKRNWTLGAPVRLASFLRAVRSLSVNGTDIPPPYTFTSEGFLRTGTSNPGFWDSPGLGFASRGAAVATFEHGQDVPPSDVSWAVLTLAAEYLIPNPITDRATQAGSEGGATINLSTPGLLGSRFGNPKVDQICENTRQAVIA